MPTGVLWRGYVDVRSPSVDPSPEGGLHRERAAPPSRPLRERHKRERGATWR